MASPRYPLTELLEQLDDEYRPQVQQLVEEHQQRLQAAPGSGHNHQAWPGGYWDHVTEVCNLAVIMYEQLNACRPLPFTLSDALLVLFCHDLEKPWRYDEHGNRNPALAAKAAKAMWRRELLDEYRIMLTEQQQNALQYVEGEMDDYRNDRRVMNELAAFCHACDVLSARMWPEYPAA